MSPLATLTRQLGRRFGRPVHAAAHPGALWHPLKTVSPAHAGRMPDFPLPQYRDVDPQRTVFFDAGVAPAASPVDAVVFLHGLGSNLTHWQFVAPALAGAHRVVGLDLPGFGETRPLGDAELTYGALRDHVWGLLDRLGLERVVVVGHSFGGAIATEMALQKPERVRGLVLLSPAGYHRFPWWVRSGSHVVLNPLFLAPVTVLSAPLVPGQVCRTPGPEVSRFTRAVFRPQNALRTLVRATRTTHTLRRELVERDFVDELHRLDLPAVTLWGEADRVLNAESSAAAAARLPQGRVVRVPGMGHMPLIERPDLVQAAVRDVLGRLVAPAVRPEPAVAAARAAAAATRGAGAEEPGSATAPALAAAPRGPLARVRAG